MSLLSKFCQNTIILSRVTVQECYCGQTDKTILIKIMTRFFGFFLPKARSIAFPAITQSIGLRVNV